MQMRRFFDVGSLMVLLGLLAGGETKESILKAYPYQHVADGRQHAEGQPGRGEPAEPAGRPPAG